MSHRPRTALSLPPPEPTRLFVLRANATPALIGTMVGGYRIEREIGRGGMGVVYCALHPLLANRAAVKVLHQELSSRTDLRERFIAEARAAATVRHPHIVRIFDLVPLPDGRLCLVMEYLEGETLEQHAGQTPMAPARVRSILLQLCGALAMAHHHGIVHRDLKAQNVLLVAGGVQDYVKLLDFGLAKAEAVLAAGRPGVEEDGTPPGTWMGSPHYMAPEQVMGEGVDRRADVYALGVLGYRLLTGALPFDGTPTQVMYHHVHTPPRDPVEVPLPLRQLILKALAKRREDRFSTMGELGGALQACRLEPPERRKAAPAPAPFTVKLEGSDIILHFVSEEAFRHVERHELSTGRLFVPGPPPQQRQLLTLIVHVPGRPIRTVPVELLGLFGQRAAEKYGIPEGFALALKGVQRTRAPEAPQARRLSPRAERLHHGLAATFGLLGAARYAGYTIDLSATGLSLRSSFVLPVGIELSIAVTLPSRRLAQVRGVVIWARQEQPAGTSACAGLRLLEADEHYLQFVASGSALAREPRAAAGDAAASVTEKVLRSTPPE